MMVKITNIGIEMELCTAVKSKTLYYVWRFGYNRNVNEKC